jgi:uncharacterized hydrophobic protein (TIGR00271 family)
MLHVRMVTPADTVDQVMERLLDDETICNVVALPDVARRPDGHLITCDVARENASLLLDSLRDLGLEETGSVSVAETGVMMSATADRAEQRAPGQPVDAVIWEAIERQASDDAAMSWSFLAFLVLATLIAGTGRYLDEPILIVGAMVVGPEFAPVSAICVGLARRRRSLVTRASRTVLTGFAISTAAAAIWWLVAYLPGWITRGQAANGGQTSFIVHPDIWSLVIAMLPGVAGVLSLTTAKSAALVGVFISVTTVPAAGAIALSASTGLWNEAGLAAVQLVVNILGIIAAGTVTLLVQRLVWSRVSPRQTLVHVHRSAAPRRH